MRGGRGWAYAAAILGGAVSVAANVAHAYVPPEGAPAGWAPHRGAVFGAVFWPVAFFLCIEVIARVDWPAGRKWVVVRFGGLLPVAVVAAAVSYQHLSGLLRFYGENDFTARVGPLAIDGLLGLASGALIATSRSTERDETTTHASPVGSTDSQADESTAGSDQESTQSTGTPSESVDLGG